MEYKNPLLSKKPTGLNIDYIKTYLDNDSSTDSLTSSSYSASTKTLNYSSDSFGSFEDYQLNNEYSDSYIYSPYYGSRSIEGTSTPTSFVYFRCVVPVNSSTCTRSFISSMCCDCGRGY
jgi:hypothetical protein